MTKTRTNTHFALLVGALLGLAGCGGGSGSGAATGTLSLRLTDGPIAATGVMIQFEGLEIKTAGEPPKTYPFNSESCDEFDSMGHCTIDLMDLTGAAYRTVFHGDLPVGEVDWIRLLVKAERNVKDSYIALRDETECPLWIPSGSETGLKIIGGITVTANGVSKYMLDFDLNRSVIQPPGLSIPPVQPPTEDEMCEQNYLLKPVVRIVDETEAGSIAGVVDPGVLYDANNADAPFAGCEENAEGIIDDLQVYVFEDFANQASPAELDDYEGDLGDPIASGIVNYDMDAMEYSYEVGYLLTGNYLLGLACNTDLDEPAKDEFDVATHGLQECETDDASPEAAFCFLADRTVDVQAEIMNNGDFPDVTP